MSSYTPPPGMPNLPNPEAIFDSWWPIIIALVAGLGYAFRQYMRGARCISELKLEDKVAIVTGGTSGIGKEVAVDLAKRGCKVYITCRTTEQGNTAVTEIKETSKSEKVFSIECQLHKLSSVRDFVEAFKKKEDNLHFLIHNAGVMMCDYNVTEDGFEEQFQVNYLSPFLMTTLLMDHLKASTPCRILFNIAPAYNLGKINFPYIESPTKEGYVPGEGYSQSKLALALFGIYLADHLKDQSISVHCVYPGVVNTQIYRHLPFKKSAFVSLSFSPFIWFLMKTPMDGAQTVLYAVLSEAVGKTTGKFYKECSEGSFIEEVKDKDLQQQLWEKSLEWIKVKEFGS